jgi:gentisate 1,2-dioxygenase
VAHHPRATENAFHWSWDELVRLAEQAGDQVTSSQAERRVLVLANPAYGGKIVTTGTLNAAIQILNVNETSEPHRHSMSAIRLITSRDGGITTVNDTKCPMMCGDLILTPAWCWHGHFNDTVRRAMWIDVLDVPLVAGWDGIFFEHPDADSPKLSDAQFAHAAWSGPGIIQAGFRSTTDYSPKLRYSWVETKPALDATPADDRGHREIRYVNPSNGEPVLPTIDCYAARLQPGSPTTPRRSTASTLCYVLQGNGKSTIGSQEILWSQNDIFTVPHWQWASHLAEDEVSYIIQVSNRGMLSKLGLLREELRD